LQDPTLELHAGNGDLLATNDNWRTDQETEIIATTVPPTDDAESAIVQTLTPGPYTAIVRGVNDTTGVALVEVYALQ
jgi:tRNA A37 threonylcarbamoyladenosine synthetase subunit TsaC/SUA5/YrdC